MNNTQTLGGGWVSSTRDSAKTNKKINLQMRNRINLRIAQGWSLEKIGHRTVWTMFGHLYSIKNNVLYVKMSTGTESFSGVAQ
jgi:hypothetical protein